MTLKKLFRPFFVTKQGKPKLLCTAFLLSTVDKTLHQKVSAFLQKEDVVLDIGAREFRYTMYQEVKAIVGVDLPSESGGYLGWTKVYGEIAGRKNIYRIYGTCEELPFADSVFDKIVLIEVIEHIVRDELALSEIARVMKKDAMLFLTTPNGDEVENTNPYHIRHYHPKDLIKLLEELFYEVNAQIYFPNTKLYIKQYLPSNRFLPRKLFWRYVYEIWLKMQGQRRHDGGYSLHIVCSKPRNKIKTEGTDFAINNITACPRCKSNLKEKYEDKNRFLFCSSCKNSYQYKYNIPYLLTETPHHQSGPSSLI